MPELAGGLISVTYVLLSSGLAMAAGGLVCILLRKSWGAGDALIDGLLAAACAFAAAYGVLELDRWGRAPYPPAMFVLPVAVCSVVVRHLARMTV